MATAARRGTLAATTAGGLLLIGALAALGLDAVLPARPADVRVAEAEHDQTMVWIARVLLWLAASWLVIGMVSARTRLVRRPGAAAARASWISSTRPWRARESTLGMLPLDRWLMILVPGALLVATRAVQTSLTGWVHLAAALAGWLVFAGVVRIVVGRRSPWPVIAAVAGVVVMRCILTLIALSVTGPGGYWLALWNLPVLRFAYVALAVALLLWAFVAAGWALSTQLGVRRGAGAVVAAVGAGVALLAASIALAGPGWIAATWLDEIGLARLPGAEASIDLSSATAWAVSAGAAVVALVGVVLAVPRADARRRVGGRA